MLHDLHRPNLRDYIQCLFPDFIELCGDRFFGNDPSIIGGIASLDGMVVTIVGNIRGNTVDERLKTNFSMAKPEGYRKVIRLMKQAEKFNRPIICFVDTIGAYPGKEAEERGQANAIANCIMNALSIRTPILSVLLGNGGSGGALALCISDHLVALEHSTLSVISPKACAKILLKDFANYQEVTDMLKMRSVTLFKLGIIDELVAESYEGTHTSPCGVSEKLRSCLSKALKRLTKIPTKLLVRRRHLRYKKIGVNYLQSTRSI